MSAGASAAAQPSTPTRVEPDLIVVNARVYTVDVAQPRAEAFAVKNGRFVAVGSSVDVRNGPPRGRRSSTRSR